MHVTLENAQVNLAKLIAKVAAGESVVITDHEKSIRSSCRPLPRSRDRNMEAANASSLSWRGRRAFEGF